MPKPPARPAPATSAASSAKRARRVAPWTAAALIAAWALAASCAKTDARVPAEPADEGFAVPAGGSLALVVDGDGRFARLDAPPNGGAAAQAPSLPARSMPFPIAVVPAAVQPMGSEAIVAINRKGLARLTVRRGARGVIEAGGKAAGKKATAAKPGTTAAAEQGPAAAVAVRIEPLEGAEGEFSGRTVSGMWARDGACYLLLYRHPVWETESPRDPCSIVLKIAGGAASAAQPSLGPDVYAVFPLSRREWLVQSRADSGDRVSTSYTRFDPDSGSFAELSRERFERSAQPLPMSDAPASLAKAAEALSGPLLVEARLADGSRRAYVRGDPGEAAPAWGQVLEPGDGTIAAIVAADDWRVAIAKADAAGVSATARRLEAPVVEARVRDAAIVDGLAVLAWEEDLFPEVGLSGLCILDLGL